MNAFDFTTAVDDGVDSHFLSTTIQVRKWERGRGWRCRRLRKPARVARGETFSRWLENGAFAPGPGVEVACVARIKVSRWVLTPIFLLTVGQPLDISFPWLSLPKIHGSVSGGWMKHFRCDETKKTYPFFFVNLLLSCSHFTHSEYLRTCRLTADDQRLHLRRLMKTC